MYWVSVRFVLCRKPHTRKNKLNVLWRFKGLQIRVMEPSKPIAVAVGVGTIVKETIKSCLTISKSRCNNRNLVRSQHGRGNSSNKDRLSLHRDGNNWCRAVWRLARHERKAEHVYGLLEAYFLVVCCLQTPAPPAAVWGTLSHVMAGTQRIFSYICFLFIRSRTLVPSAFPFTSFVARNYDASRYSCKSNYKTCSLYSTLIFLSF